MNIELNAVSRSFSRLLAGASSRLASHLSQVGRFASATSGLCIGATALFTFGVATSAEAGNTLAPGYELVEYFSAGGEIISFDWGSNGQLYYTNGTSLYSGSSSISLYDWSGYPGMSVVAIGDHIYFNTDNGMSQEIQRYDWTSNSVTRVSEASNFGLYKQNGTLFVTAGDISWENHIFYTTLDTSGDFGSGLIDLGKTGGGSGPLTFDAGGNLYYSTGYGAKNIYRWSASDVSQAMLDPITFSLKADSDHLWLELDKEFVGMTFDGGTSVLFDEKGDLLLTLTSFGSGSSLVKLGVDEFGIFDGSTVLLTADGRLGDLRYYEGGIYIADGNTIYQVVPEPSVFFFALAGLGVAMGARRFRRRAVASLMGIALAASALPSYAGPYSQAKGDQDNEYDAGIPGFVGPAGDGKTGGGNYVNPIFVGWATSYSNYLPAPGVSSGFSDPTKALGPVTGINTDIVSLGDLYSPLNAPKTGVKGVDYGVIGDQLPGSITLGFDLAITNGVGADFAIFENAFISGYTTGEGSQIGMLFAEFAYVEVSTDGIHFARFPSISETPNPVGAYGTVDPTGIYNLAGKHVNAYGESWGTPFDLDDLQENEFVLGGFVDLAEIHFVRIVDIPGSGDFLDSLGHPIYDAWVTWGSGGFDLEALGVIHQVPEPSAFVLGLAGVFGGLALWRRRSQAS